MARHALLHKTRAVPKLSQSMLHCLHTDCELHVGVHRLVQGREPEVPELKVEELAVAVHRGTYNACVDLATQVRAKQANQECSYRDN